ncbi:MAG: 16S rRNA (guanine(527)-N(7))-methyltransferase RsmG [Clostridiales bacterium]|nr:16S rRNA (guanine(527)-N(7))-methyltransferase RsmG [Clostridiales bacterium]
MEWNGKINLTAIKEPRDVMQKHFADSLATLPYLPQGAKIVDVGTGAGFPGVPLLIVRPDLRVTLCDSLQKRIKFLELLCRELDIKAELVHARAEDLGQNPKHREKYDFALTRAVASLPVLLELTLPLVKVGGKSLCYKGEAAEELQAARSALRVLHASAQVQPIPSEWGLRNLIICTKNALTDKQYPRKAGTPGKNPL